MIIIIIIIIILLISSPNIEQSSLQHTQQNRTKLNTYIYIHVQRSWGVYELSPIEDYNIYKDYLPLYTTVSLNVYKKYLGTEQKPPQ